MIAVACKKSLQAVLQSAKPLFTGFLDKRRSSCNEDSTLIMLLNY